MSITKLSIITINKNNAQGLLNTIESVILQTYSNFEFIVIDGNSNDKSVEYLKKYSNKIDYWISENDRGIYHAMNKGAFIAKGEYLLFLNSGDKFCNNSVLKDISSYLDKFDIISGYSSGSKDNREFFIYPPEKFKIKYFFNKNIPHQAEFIKTSSFFIIGKYNEELKILSDYEFNLKAIKSKFNYLYLNIKISELDLNGISNNDQNYEILLQEKVKILKSLNLYCFYKLFCKWI